MSRPKTVIDWQIVEDLLMAQCTGVEIAESLGIHPETLYNACERDHKMGFSVYSQQKRARGTAHAKITFYRQCWESDGVSKSTVTAQIFWLKNYAGMSDKHDLRVSQPETRVKMVLFELPDNKTGAGQLGPVPPGFDTIVRIPDNGRAL